MNRLKKRYLLPICGLAGALILLGAAVVFLPPVFSLDSVKQLIESKVSILAGGKIRYQEASLEFIPWPQMVFKHSSITIENQLSGQADVIVVIPKPLPLLIGKIRIGSISAAQPSFRINLPASEKDTLEAILPINALAGALSKALSGMEQTLQGSIVVQLKNGHIELIKETRPVLSFENITGEMHLSARHVSLKLSAGSKQEGSLALGLDLNPNSFTGNAYLHFHQYAPDKVLSLLYPDNDIKIDGAGFTMKSDFLFQNAETFSGTIEGTWPGFSLSAEKEIVSFRNGRIKSAIAFSPSRTELQISRLSLSYPALTMSARFLADRATPVYQWEINARALDLDSTGKTARALAPRSHVVQTLFRTLKAGTIRSITIEDMATSLEALKKAAGLKVNGLLENGTVYVPKPDLTLTQASGWVTVAGGVLEGKNLSAQLGNAKCFGAYSMRLNRQNPAFFLDAAIEADVSELPPLLHRLIAGKTFKKEMPRISGVKGNAIGRLIIDKSESRIAVTVDVSRFNLSGNYDRIPYPIRIRNGRFHYDADQIRLENIQGRIGKTSFSGLNAHIGRNTPFPLNIQANGLQIDMDEVFPWLQQYDAIAAKLTELSTVNGGIHATAVTLKGPALLPSDWQFALTGEVSALEILTPHFPSPIRFKDGKFTAAPDVITFEQAHITAMDTQTEAHAKFSGYLTKAYAVEATLRGAMGPKTADWVKTQLKMPVFLTWPTPRLMTPIFLKWDAHAGLALSGHLQTQEGPEVGFALEKRPDSFSIKKLTIQDHHSNATLSLRNKNQVIDLSFSGRLLHKTVDALIAENPYLFGRIEGNFHTRFKNSSPHLSTATGHLYVEALDLNQLKFPLTIQQAALSGTENKLRISHAQLDWEKYPLLLDGNIRHYRDGLDLNLTLAMGELNWARLSDLLKRKPFKNAIESDPEARRFPLYGQIQAHVENFILTPKIAFRPLDAKLSFKGKETNILVNEAMLCGIPISGAITKTPNAYRLEATPAAKGNDLTAALACLSGKGNSISGLFQLDGHLAAAAGTGTPISAALTGELAFAAEKGRIHRFGLAAKVFTLLNVAGLLQGELPEIETEGFPYKTAQAKAVFDKGILHITEGVIDSSAMKIFFQGEENLMTKTHNLEIVAAPLKTVDLLVSHIPLVRDILDKGLVIYPIKVSGTWDKPDLNLLSPNSVGKEIWGIIIRTFNLPFKMIEPLFPEKKETQPATPDKRPSATPKSPER